MVKGWASIPESYVTQVPVLSLDRVLGDALHGRRALILVDIEGAEYMLLQGAVRTLVAEPRPIWIMEISSTEHQPMGTLMNPNFAATFELFFENGYRGFTVEQEVLEITPRLVQEVITGVKQLGTHNFIFK